MAIINTALKLIPANIYVSSGNTVVSVMYFCNQGASAANLNLWAVAAPASLSSTTSAIYKEVQIAAADTFVVDLEKLVLSPGDQIKGNSGGQLMATVSYVGI